MSSTIAIGGIGGSGTRVVAKITEELGYFIGNDLNDPLDNLLFTLFFKRQNILTLSSEEIEELWTLFQKLMSQPLELSNEERVKIELLADTSRVGHPQIWLQNRVENINSYKFYSKNKWAWKEPNTHIIIDKFLEKRDDLKFIYVYRNGLDMAYSTNQNQLKFWGPIFFNDFNLEITPSNSLAYWCMIHKRMIILKNKYPNRVLLLEFESLCESSSKKISEIEAFCNSRISEKQLEEIKSLISMPSTVGRYRNFSLNDYNIADIEYVKKIYPHVNLNH